MTSMITSIGLRKLRPFLSKKRRKDLDFYVKRVKHMEGVIDDWPKKRAEHPDTSDWDGTVEGLKPKQRDVYWVFQQHPVVLDAVQLEALYLMVVDFDEVSLQAPSGIRARMSEIAKLGLIEFVDKNGISPTGRIAQRHKIVLKEGMN